MRIRRIPTHTTTAGYLEIGDYDRAITDFSKAISLKHDFAEAYYNRGIVQKRLIRRTPFKHAIADFTKAIADFERVLSIDPNFALAYAGMGDACYRTKNTIALRNSSRKRWNEDWIRSKVGEKGLAGVYASRARNLNAGLQSIIYYNKALELEPELMTAIGHQASNYKIIGEYERAIELYEREISLKKGDPTYLWLYHYYQ